MTVVLNSFGNDTALSWNAVLANLPVYGQVYDTLVTISGDGAPEPDLAESWQVSEDRLTYTFTLRERVPFHKGYGDLTADDVVFTAQKWLEPSSTGFTAQAIRSNVASVEKVDDRTVSFHLKKPNPFFLESLGDTAWILSRRYVEKVGDKTAAREPVGTGPFEWTSTSAGSQVTFTRVKGHFARDADYPTLVLRVIPDVSTQLAALESGEVDVVQVAGDTLKRAKSQNFKIMETRDATQSWVVLPGLSAPATSDYRPQMPWVGDSKDPASAKNAKTVRHALAMAIDKEEIVKSIYAGAGATDSFGYYVRKGFPGYSEAWKPLSYDPDQARKLLAAAGYPNGFSIKLVDSGGASETSAITQAIGQYWEAIGIDVKLSKLDPATVIANNQSRSKSADYAVVYSVPGAMKPSASTRAIASTGGFRFVVNDAETDAEIARIVQESDAKARAALIETMMSRLIDEQYGLQIAVQNATFAVSGRVAGWTLQAGNGSPNNYQFITLAGR
ncbi:ABC transporter substrate-binding protein [Dactylosporangium sp. NPDC000555]|uniref:ABC transporter substrate-binding protein n=1 Tax=Dactylosporangium sp. NPDC000555 TaxID=3154260 RepID=UPI003317A57E